MSSVEEIASDVVVVAAAAPTADSVGRLVFLALILSGINFPIARAGRERNWWALARYKVSNERKG